MSQNSMEQALNDLQLNKGSDDDATIADFVKNPQLFASKDGLKRLLQVLQLANLHPLSEMVLNDPDSLLELLLVVGDTKGQLLVTILRKTHQKGTVINHLLDILKVHLKANLATTLPLQNSTFYLNVYLSLLLEFQVFNCQHLYILLAFLNPYLGDIEEVSAIVLLISVNMLKHSQKTACEVIGDYLETIYLEKDSVSVSEYFNFIKIMELFMPLIPELLTPIYINHSKVLIDHEVSKIKDAKDILKNKPLVVETLKLFAGSCINDECRQFIHNNYLTILKFAIKIEDYQINLLTSLIIIKLWQFVKLEKDISIESLASNLLLYISKYSDILNNELLEYAIEGLAYLSLNTTIKKTIRADESVLDILVGLLGQDLPSSVMYGILVMFNNITTLPDMNGSLERETRKYLKNIATPNAGDNTKESKTEVVLFNKSLLLNQKIVEVASKLKTNDTSGSKLIDLLINIIYLISMNQEKQTKIELVKQGSLKLVMNYLIKNSKVNKESGVTRPKGEIGTRVLALRVLAKILYSINPDVAFNEYDIRSALPFLVELLGPESYSGLQPKKEDSYLFENITSLDKFESLLAITNISSLDRTDLKRFIIASVFDKYLDNFIIDSDHPQIQKASWELISNLINEPTMLTKFFNIDETPETKLNSKRLNLLISLLDSEDEGLQIVLAGLLANATSEFDMISEVLLKFDPIRTKLLTKITVILKDQSDNVELILRLAYIISNLVYTALNSKQLAKLQDASLQASIALVLKRSKNSEIVDILQDALKHLQ